MQPTFLALVPLEVLLLTSQGASHTQKENPTARVASLIAPYNTVSEDLKSVCARGTAKLIYFSLFL
jgi:hypothetical protein